MCLSYISDLWALRSSYGGLLPVGTPLAWSGGINEYPGKTGGSAEVKSPWVNISQNRAIKETQELETLLREAQSWWICCSKAYV